MRIAFVTPPLIKPSEPGLSAAAAASAFRSRGVDAFDIDASLGWYRHTFAPGNLESALRQAEGEGYSAGSLQAFRQAQREVALPKPPLQRPETYGQRKVYSSAVSHLVNALRLASVPHPGFHLRVADVEVEGRRPQDSGDLEALAQMPGPFDAYFLEELIPQLEAERVTHVGLSLTFLNQAFATFRLAFLLAEQLPAVQRILGGPLVACWNAVGASLDSPAFLRFHRILAATSEAEMDALALELGARPSISRGRAGAPAERGQEGDEGLGGSKDEAPDAASRRLPPQPEGLSAKGSLALSARSDDEPASPLTRLRAIKPFALNAAPGEYLDGLLGGAPSAQEAVLAPDLAATPWGAYMTPMPIVPVALGRGCYWRRCAFCPDYLHPAYRPGSRDALSNWLEEVASRFPKGAMLHLTDSALSPALLARIADVISAGRLPLRWHGFVRLEARFGDPGFAERLAEGGCAMLQWGLETAAPHLLDLMDKGVSAEQARRALRSCADAGIKNHAYLLFGLPTETEADRETTLGFVQSEAASLHDLNASILNLPRRSPMHDEPERYGITALSSFGQDTDLSLYADFRCGDSHPRVEARRWLSARFLKDSTVKRILGDLNGPFKENHSCFLPK